MLDKKINFRCDEAFETLLYGKMQQAGYHSYSEFIREAVSHTIIKQRCTGLQELVRELNRIGVNLNQVTKHVNEQKMIDQLALTGISNIYTELTTLVKRYNQ
jgi:Arc/MetJ-type ribon-helix-helix transcriptional regulator